MTSQICWKSKYDCFHQSACLIGSDNINHLLSGKSVTNHWGVRMPDSQMLNWLRARLVLYSYRVIKHFHMHANKFIYFWRRKEIKGCLRREESYRHLLSIQRLNMVRAIKFKVAGYCAAAAAGKSFEKDTKGDIEYESRTYDINKILRLRQ